MNKWGSSRKETIQMMKPTLGEKNKEGRVKLGLKDTCQKKKKKTHVIEKLKGKTVMENI